MPATLLIRSPTPLPSSLQAIYLILYVLACIAPSFDNDNLGSYYLSLHIIYADLVLPLVSCKQRNVMLKAMPLVEERVRAFYGRSFPKYFAVADLGCSSGPNSLLAVTGVIETLTGLCNQGGHSPPEVLLFLNDLPGNDFNSVFTSLPSFYENLKQKNKLISSNCFISAMPGSFYGRLFPSRSLHFVHSSYSVHWLSQVTGKILSFLQV